MNAEEFAQQLAASASSDQRSALIANIAADVAAYHAQLVKSGIPSTLAAELTMQAGHFIWGGSNCTCDDDD